MQIGREGGFGRVWESLGGFGFGSVWERLGAFGMIWKRAVKARDDEKFRNACECLRTLVGAWERP